MHNERADVRIEHLDLVHRLNRPSSLTISSRSAIKSGAAFWRCVSEPYVDRIERMMMLMASYSEQVSRVWLSYRCPAITQQVIYTTNGIESLNDVIKHPSKKYKVYPTNEIVIKGGNNPSHITEMNNTSLLSSLVTAMTITLEQRNLPQNGQ